MALLQRVKDVLGRDRTTATREYNCRECESRFETDETSTTALACPHCGASGSRAIERL